MRTRGLAPQIEAGGGRRGFLASTAVQGQVFRDRGRGRGRGTCTGVVGVEIRIVRLVHHLAAHFRIISMVLLLHQFEILEKLRLPMILKSQWTAPEDQLRSPSRLLPATIGIGE